MANDRFGSNGGFQSALRRKVSIAVEVLLNLAYLTKLSAEEPVEVRRYVNLTEDQLSKLAGLLGGSTTTRHQAS